MIAKPSSSARRTRRPQDAARLRAAQRRLLFESLEERRVLAVTVGDVSILEGDTGTSNLVFTVTREVGSTGPVDLTYSTADGTATAADQDYVPVPSGNVTIPDGVDTATISITVNGDYKVEGNETFTLTVGDGVTDVTATGTITNDDSAPVIALPGTPASYTESIPAGGAIIIDGTATVVDDSPNFDGGTLTVSITAGAHVNDRLGIFHQGIGPGQIGVSGADVTFAGTTIGTFTGGAGAPLVVSFNAAATPAAAQALLQNITFDSTDAPAGAATRTVQFVVTDGDGGTSNTAAVNINVTGLAEISVSDAVVTEGNAGTVNLAFTITATGVTTPVLVNYSTANGTAIAGSDYAAIASGSFTFNVSGSQVVNVVINGDTTFEPNETLVLNITAPTAVVTDPQGQGTITNDDLQPAISIGDVAQSEGNGGGTTAFTFTISLSNPSYQTVTVSAQSQFGTANAADFAALPLTLVTFNPGETSKTVTVNVNADGTFEGNEDFQVVLSSPTNATIADGTGVGTINNDDPQPTISIADLAAQNEGNGGTTPFVFTVTLSNPSDQTITVQAQPQVGTANAADFASMAASLVTFAPGETSKTVTVNVNADNMYEGNETFTVALSSPTNATIADGSATGTINNDDPLPTVSVTSVTLNEGNAGTTTYTFSVSLSNPSDQPITVNYSTADDTATTADGDYVATSGTLTFPAGSTTAQTFSVNVNGDNKFENTETFRVNLTTTNAANPTLQATGTITNDDTIPSMTITSAVALEEGNSGTTAFNYTVTLSNASAFDVTVDYNVVEGTATLANNDFLPTSGTLTIPAGSLTGTITVEVVGDDKVELDETFSLVLSNPQNATIASGTGAGTIINDDGIVNAGYLNPALINDGNADTFRLVRNGDNLDLYVNDNPTPVKSFILANTDSLDVQGSSDSDRLVIDYSGGYWRVPLGITYNGNRLGPDTGDNDALEIRGGAGVAFDRETYVVGASQDAGTWTLNPELAVAGDETVIVFSGLEPVDSDAVAVDFEIVMNGAANDATLENGGLLNGFTSLQLTDNNATFETTRFANKTNVYISGMGGSDSFTSNYTTPSDGLATVSFYGHAGPLVVAPPADDNAADSFFFNSNAAGIVLAALGQGGDDSFSLGSAGFVLANLNGTIQLTGGETGETVGDAIFVVDINAAAPSNPTLTSTQLTGAAPGTINYSEAETFRFDSADGQDTTLTVLSTAAGTSYLVELAFGASQSHVIVGTAGAVNAGAGTLDNIAGPITFEFNNSDSRLQIDDSGDATGDNVTISRDATHTTIAGASPAAIRYSISAGDSLEEFELYTGSGADTINVQTTTASVSSLINSNGGNDTFNITGNDLSADNRFLSGDGQDVFNATFANPGAPLFATALVEFNGGNVDNTDNRDRLNLNDTAAAGRALTFAYGANASDLAITTGFGFPINIQQTETLVYNSTGGADTVAVVGTTGDDDLTIVPRSPNEALIFNGGDPFDGPPETITGNLPGVAGGGIGPDIRMIGLTGNINVAGGGSVTGDQLYVYARNEQSILDPGTTDDIFGLGAGVLIPGVGVGNAYDTITTDGTSVVIAGLATVTLAPGSFVQNDPQRPGLIVNGGDEAAPAANGLADQFFVTPSAAFAIHVNGGNPLPAFAPNGDSLILTAIGDLNVYSDKASPPNVSVVSSTSPFEVTFSSIERTLLVPSTGVVNLIGDNNNTTPQTDNFVVVGADIDQVFNPLTPPADGGVGEFTLQINGSAPIFFDNVQFLNVVGHELVDTLEITAYADNTPRGWGIDVFYDEGLPTQTDGGQLDLLIYNTSVNAGDVSEDIVIQPSGPENGELRVTNGAFGTPIVVVSFVNNLDIIVNDDDGDLPDTDTLTLRGTNPDAVQTSGNELFDADFTRAGDVANPLVVVSDLDPLNVGAPLLYRLRNFTGFGSINFATLGGTDEIQITNRAGLTVNVDGGVPVTEDVLNVVVPTSAIIRQGVDASTGEIITPDAGTIHFQNVSQINITSAAAGSTLTVDGTDNDDAITVAAGAAAGEGTVTINGGPVIGFNAAGTNFTTLVVNGRAGDDHYQLAPIAGVAQTIAAGSGQDTAQVTGTAAAEDFTFTPTAADAATLATVGFGLVTFTGSEAIALNGNGGGDTINLVGTAADDSFAFDPATTNSGSFTSTLSPSLTFESYASASVTGGAGGFDQVALTGTNGDDTVTSTATTLTLGATTITFSAIDHIDIATLGGVDVLNLLALAGVTFSVDGGDPANSDVLNVTVPTSATIRQGVDASSGEIVMPDAGTIGFKNVSQINITSAAAGSTLTVDGTDNDDAITVAAGAVPGEGTVTINGGPVIGFNAAGTNFTTLVVNGRAGDDHYQLAPIAGVAQTIAAGSGQDTAQVTGTAAAEDFTFTPTAADAATLATVGFGLVTFTGSEAIALNGNGGGDTINLVGTAADDSFVFDPSTTNSGSFTSTLSPSLTFESYASASVTGGAGGFDQVALTGTNGDDTVTSTATTLTLGATTITFSAIDHIDIATLGGVDVLNLLALAGVTFSVDGGDPANSDVLNVTVPTNAIIRQGVDASSGEIVMPDAGTISFQNVSQINIASATAGSTLTVEGTSDVDTIEVAANGMVTVNDGPAISIGANFGTLDVNGLAGDDAITINPLVGVAINVAGGGTSGDRVTFLGTAGADAITFTPTSDDDATIAVVGFGLTTLTDVENVSIDGQGGGDTLTVNGTAADDTFHVQPTGAGTGSLVSSQSPVLDFRSFTTLNVNGGAGGIDEVVITGTAGADAVTSTANSIILGSTIVFGAGIDHLELSTLGGDDNINLLAFTAVVASAGLPATTIFGGDGNDTVIGTNSIDLIYGGSGNDVLIGAGDNDTIYGEDGDDRFGDPAVADPTANDGGNDTFFGGAGSDTLVWDPGDGSDIFEGGEGIDVLIFNGSGAAETFTVATTASATTNTPSPGARLLLQRDVGGINMNMAGVEQIDLQANAGADRVNVQDVASTELAHLNINLGADAVDDIVTVHGRNVADNITATAAGGIVSVVGLEYDIAISGSTAPPDQLVIEGHEGDDTIIAAPGVEDLIGLTLSGGAGNDFLSGDGTLIGGAGDDILIGGDLGNLLQGGDGNDFLVGNAGDDTLEGGAGDDILVGGTGNDTLDGGTGYDSILIEGTSAIDTIDVFQSALTANTTTLTYTVNGVTENDTILLVAAGGNTSVEQAIIEAGAGADLIRVNWRDNTGVNFGVDAATGNSLRYTVRGGDDQTSDRLLVVDDGIDDLTIYRKAESDSAGTVSIGPANSEALQTVFSGIEHVQFLTTSDTGVYPVAPVAPNTAGTNSRLVVFKHDPFEYNNDRTVATHIGVGQSLNVDPTIDPAGVTNPFGDGTDIPGDSDWYRVEALVSGTLDFQVFFDQIASVGARPGLPGSGDIDIEVYDSTGDLVANFGANNGGSELDPDGDNERIRIPAVQGQTYYLRVYGRTAPVVNNYNISVINLAPPTPYDIELDDVLGQGTVNAVVANGFSANNLAAPNLPLSTVDDYYNGKYLTFTSGALAGQRALVADYVGATRTFTFAVGAFSGAIPAGATFQVESVDTGRSQFDNTTADTTPTIILRLDDGILLNDLPGNSTPGLPPDQVITIPFQGTNLAPGYRIAIFDEGDGLAPNTDAPQVPVGYATATADPGVYTFTFTTPLTPGSHFISARVQMIDPANPQQTGFGPRSVSMEIVVDPISPPVAFGEIAVANDGLHPDSDSGVLVNPSTYDDRITNDETPTFWGVAEANSVIRVYVDQNGNGVVDAGDVLIAQTVTTPLDGTNQFPGGRWEATSAINLNDEDLFPVDGLRTILVTAEDLAGNVSAPASLEIFLDTQAPVITGVEITGIPGFDLFAPKPATTGPTPLVDSLTIKVSDLPARIAQFLYDALDEKVAETPGHYVLVGDFSGIIPIEKVDFIPDPLVPGQPATGEIIITFFEPLPDDRFTLTISDELVDPAGNNLDGESDGVEPDGSPSYPTGDGQPGGDFVVRFTVDSRAEVGSWASSSVWVDHNGNGYHDPASPVDFTNRDITYALGYTPDTMFAGNFAANGLAADGFDKIASYGPVGGVYRFLVDFDNDGVPDPLPAVGPGLTVLNINGLPVAGNFDGNAVNGDEVGVFSGDRWYFDTNRNFVIDSGDLVRMTGLRGYPVVGDFDGDGFDDLATYQNDHFYFDLTDGVANGWNGVADFDVRFGFAGVRERPVAGDMDGDGIDDIGLWVPDRVAPQPTSEWYIIVSGGSPIVKAGLPQNSPGHRVDRDLVDGKNIFNFSPTPFNNDLYLSFGDEFAQPILGNFDPPLESNPAAVTGVFTNPRNALDVNDDGMISPLDALLVINQLNAQGSRPMTSSLRSDAGPFYDVNNDQQVTPLDALTLIIYLNSHGTGPATAGEDASSPSLAAATTSTSESSSPTSASSLPFGNLDSGSTAASSSTVETGDDGLLAYLAEPSVAPTTFDPQVVDNAGPTYGSGDGSSDELNDVLDSIAGELAEVWN